MDVACSRYGEKKMHKGCWLRKEREHLEVLVIDGYIILKLMFIVM